MEKEASEKITRHNLLTGIKVLFRYISVYKRDIVVLSVISLIAAIGNAAIPYIMGRFIDSITSSAVLPLFGYMIPVFGAVLALWIVIQLVTYFMDWRIQIFRERLSNTIWLDYIHQGFSYLLTLPMSFHKKTKVGSIGDKISRAAHALETIVGQVIIDLGPQMLSVVIAVGIALWIKPLFALFLIAGILVYVITIVISVRPLAQAQTEYWDRINQSFGDGYDMINNALAIKQSVAEKYEAEKIAKKFREALPFWLKMNQIWANLSFYQRLTVVLTQTAIFVASIVFIRQGTMTVGELLAFISYASLVFVPLASLAQKWQSIQNGIINVQETERVLSMAPEGYDPKGSKPFDVRGDISFKSAGFHYDEGKTVLQDISFDVKAGEIVALVGESGVGKSTLIDLIGGYHFPTSGEVLIDGMPIEKLSLTSLRSQIAVVPQEVVLFNDTIEMNVRYGSFKATDAELREAARKAHAIDFIEKFADKWQQVVGERGIKLSVGQKQRVAIARAILRSPKILILDEPTSALDAGSEKIITQSLEELMKGKTTFIIAHRLSTVRKADKILVFKEGRIVESGTHQELLKRESGEYKRLYELQIGLHD